MKRLLATTIVATLGLGACRARPDADLPAIYREMEVPGERLASPDVQRQGRLIFHERCAACHGDLADGRGPGARGLAVSPADLTDAAWRARNDERRVFYEVAEGSHGRPMPEWKATLSPGEIWSLVAYIRTLSDSPLAGGSANMATKPQGARPRDRL